MIKKLKVCWISAGVSSFVAGYLANNIDEFIYIDIENQHSDSMRFIKDCENTLEKPIQILKSNYGSVQNVIKQFKFINGIHGAKCTEILKKRVRKEWEYALLLYRDKLPKFRNGLKIDDNGKNIPGTGRMIFNWFTWERDGKEIPKIHPAQKSVKVLKRLIEIFTDKGDVVIDPCCGGGTTLRAAYELGRSYFGFEIDRFFYERAKNEMLNFENQQINIFNYQKDVIM